MPTRSRDDNATRIPGPPELLPGCPDAVIDLQTGSGVALVGGEWRYSDARVEEIEFVEDEQKHYQLNLPVTAHR